MSPQDRTWSLADFELGPAIAKGCTAVVYSARLRSKENLGQAVTFPLAIKMMFNYHAESNAFTILRAMHRETVPARSMTVPGEVGDLVQMLDTDKVQLKAHPNIVEMVAVFADQVPDLPGAEALYPTALPSRYCYQLAKWPGTRQYTPGTSTLQVPVTSTLQVSVTTKLYSAPRLHPSGLGRNMSLFLVMKSYSLSLADYLASYRESLSPRTSLVLLTQLLEGVAFLTSSGVAHRY